MPARGIEEGSRANHVCVCVFVGGGVVHGNLSFSRLGLSMGTERYVHGRAGVRVGISIHPSKS